MSRISKTFKKFPKTFWVANTMELFERWAWYGIFMVLALYLTESKDTGALGFTQSQKGYLMGTVVGILYFLPVITGAIADKFGYKKVLVLSFIILSTGYFFMSKVTGYSAMFLVFLYVALGAALFKPVISATISKSTDDTTSTIGFGIFYMIVNIGAFVGPIFASKFRHIDWNYPFYMASIVICINIFIVLIFYKEPKRKPNSESILKSIGTVFKNMFSVLHDYKFVIFLILIIGFWSMYNQLFYTLPVFIEQWIDTSGIYKFLESISPVLASTIGTSEHTIAPEMLTNIDALYIVLFQVLVSTLVMKYKPINSIITGFLICSIGIGLWFITQNGFYLFISLLIFGIGEMMSSPRILEYVGKIAPKDKVALYMGCYFIPMAGGNFIAGILSGDVYGKIADKFHLLKMEVASRGLKIPEVSENFTKNDYTEKACQLMGLDPNSLTQFLWETYNPSRIWLIFTMIGFGTVLLLFLFDRLMLSKTKQ